MTEMEHGDATNGFITFDEALKLAKTLMDQALNTTPAPFRPRTGYLTRSPGKFLRAYSLLACAEDEEGVPVAAAKAAAAVELLHLATLVHDDIIDNSATRRGLQTLMKKFGPHQAVITGDYILCLALRLAAEAAVNEKEMPEEDFPGLLQKICVGELVQSINHRNFNLSGISYLRIISGKTAALFEGSFLTGAMLSRTGRPLAKKFAEIGWRLGMIFQLMDDCLDYESTAERAKKPVLSDFEQGVVTLPLIVAMKNLPEMQKRAFAGNITKDEVRQSVESMGGLVFTRRLSRLYYEQASRLIDEIETVGRKKQRLEQLLCRVMEGPAVPQQA